MDDAKWVPCSNEMLLCMGGKGGWFISRAMDRGDRCTAGLSKAQQTQVNIPKAQPTTIHLKPGGMFLVVTWLMPLVNHNTALKNSQNWMQVCQYCSQLFEAYQAWHVFSSEFKRSKHNKADCHRPRASFVFTSAHALCSDQLFIPCLVTDDAPWEFTNINLLPYFIPESHL